MQGEFSLRGRSEVFAGQAAYEPNGTGIVVTSLGKMVRAQA